MLVSSSKVIVMAKFICTLISCYFNNLVKLHVYENRQSEQGNRAMQHHFNLILICQIIIYNRFNTSSDKEILYWAIDFI